MTKFIHLVVLSLCCVTGVAQASFITTGTIYETSTKSTTVDRWYFTLTEDGTVTADILAKNVDVNSDGKVTHLNAMLYLFEDDGLLDSSDIVSFNSLYTLDKKSQPLDPYLSVELTAGNYILMISDAKNSNSFSIDEAIAGFNENNQISKLDYGDYQISWSDNVVITNPSVAPPVLAAASFSTFSIGTLTTPTTSAVAISEPSSLAIMGLMFFLLSMTHICRRYRPAQPQFT